MSRDCLFCRIAAHDLDGDIVFESEDVLAFRDINPRAPTHILVIPREHIPSAHEVSSAHAGVLAQMYALTSKLADDEGLSEGYRLVSNVGPAAGESVPHLHMHLMGGRTMTWPPG